MNAIAALQLLCTRHGEKNDYYLNYRRNEIFLVKIWLEFIWGANILKLLSPSANVLTGSALLKRVRRLFRIMFFTLLSCYPHNLRK